MKDKIELAYAGGKINKEQYDKLKNDISIRYKRILDAEIDLLKDSPIKPISRDNLMKKKYITDAYSDGKLTELHHKLLQERITKITSNGETHDNS